MMQNQRLNTTVIPKSVPLVRERSVVQSHSAAPELTEKNPYRSGKCWWAWEQGFARGYALARRTMPEPRKPDMGEVADSDPPSFSAPSDGALYAAHSRSLLSDADNAAIDEYGVAPPETGA